MGARVYPRIPRSVFVASLLSAVFSAGAQAATRVAATCNVSDVQAQINAASDGDVIVISNGSCGWASGITTTKQVQIRGQSFTSTPGGNNTQGVIITNNSTTGPLLEFTTGNTFNVGVTGIRFNEGSGSLNHLRFNGSGSKVPFVSDCYFEIKNRFGNQPTNGAIAWLSQGGVMWNTWIQGVGAGSGGQCCPEGASFLVNSPRAWETPSTMGSLDTDGNVNVYVEDSTFKNFGQSPDIDDRGRFVMRYSLIDGASGLTHGFTSSKGGRHAEYYNNTFTTTTSNRNIAGRYFWLRAGTIIFTDNVVNNQNQGYGSAELLTIGDTTTPTGYPQARQPGWGNNGTSSVIDPIYIWNNTGPGGSLWSVVSAWASNVQLNREIFVNSGAKPGYSKYTYPHPLRASLSGTVPPPPPPDTTAPSSPGTVTASAVSSSQINVSWTASTDNVGVTGYRVERCQGSGCSSFSQIGTPAGTSYSDTGLAANTTYSYRIRANDAAGNLSAYSATAITTTSVAADTTAPSSPGSPTASATSSSQINISWTASTDNVGVNGYRVERCQGNGCSSFAQIGTPSGTSYSDTGLAPSTAYSYRVRSVDAAGNLSAYSPTATATTQSGATTPPPLPTGNTGIASRFPGDANIKSDPNVIFADDFEAYSSVSQLTTNWSQLFQTAFTRIATEPNNVFSGGKSLEFRVPQQSAEVANGAIKTLSPAEDVVFIRAYTKFDAGYNVLGSNHNGLSLQAQYCCAGVPADGTNKFYVGLENSRDLSTEAIPGMTNLYVYHPEQRDQWGDHWYPDGRVVPFDLTPGNFGPYFVARPNFTPALDRWYCYELMVKANTPGQRDGRIAVWIDGNLVADFLNIRLRDVSTLKIDQAVLSFHIFSNTARQNFKWYDNVVIARSYIGPMSAAFGPVNPPTNISTVVH